MLLRHSDDAYACQPRVRLPLVQQAAKCEKEERHRSSPLTSFSEPQDSSPSLWLSFLLFNQDYIKFLS